MMIKRLREIAQITVYLPIFSLFITLINSFDFKLHCFLYLVFQVQSSYQSPKLFPFLPLPQIFEPYLIRPLLPAFLSLYTSL